VVKWIVLAAVLVGVLVLALVVRPLLGRRQRLGRALRRLRERQAQAEALRADMALTQREIAVAQRRIELIKSNTGD
jgi:flagellar biosynthesis/type III secretory pathway M-ring protein FliF/YscJ